MRILSRIGAVWMLIVGGLVVPANGQTTTRVSVASNGGQGNSDSLEPSISADGRYVAFRTLASTLVTGDTNAQGDVFVHDRQTGLTERVSVGPGAAQATGGNSDSPSISADGRFVAFRSYATNLVPNDTNDSPDIFVHDRQTATTTRVSVSAKGGAQANGYSHTPAISADGRYVVFSSFGSNLVVGDFNDELDIFLRDREAGTTVRISVATNGAEANDYSLYPSVSADGRVVVFQSAASNLVTGDTNAVVDVFARDLQAGTTMRLSVGVGGLQGNNDSQTSTISDDGRFVAFTSNATTFAPAGGRGIFVHDRQTGVTAPLSLVPSGTALANVPAAPKISRDGHAVCYAQFPSGQTQIFLADRLTGAIATVSLSATGNAANGSSQNCGINGDGKMVAFSSDASNLVTGDTNGLADAFVRVFPSAMALDKAALTFGAVTSGGTFVSQTAAQIVRLTQDGMTPVAWTATANQPWLQVSPASGTGTATLSVSVAPAGGVPPSGTVTGTIFLSLTGAANTLSPITVSLTLVPAGTTLSPFGNVDTPTDNRTGVTGAIPFTGWALDDIEVTRVSICRAAFGSEVAPADPNCGGAAEIFVGFAVFIDGARPDVAAAFPSYPLPARAGWGFMALTNMLPNQGNGTYTFRMRAFDREGHVSLLGTRTMTCANASATLPFGTLDTPLQGGVASGSSYVNFGWALTPQPKTIPVDGSTIHVLVDGVDVGTADYNHARSDIQALFPGFNNTDGAVGFRILNTTALTNGLHTISWTVTDDQGAVEGLGSRFFTVSNGSSALTAAAMSARAPIDVDDAPRDITPLVGRRGWDLEAPYGLFAAGANGITVIRSEEVSRIELQLGDGDYTGYLRTPAGLAPLPIGSRLDPMTKTFTWAPGVGFVGRYDFVFVRSTNGQPVSRREVRIVLHPKGRGSVGPQIVINVPRPNATVDSAFMIGGWAVDLDAPEGTGVTTLHAWAFPSSGGAPIFLGAPAYGGGRPDVAAVHGDRFTPSGFGLIAQGLAPGDYDLALFAWSTEAMSFVAPAIVRVHVRP